MWTHWLLCACNRVWGRSGKSWGKGNIIKTFCRKIFLKKKIEKCLLILPNCIFSSFPSLFQNHCLIWQISFIMILSFKSSEVGNLAFAWKLFFSLKILNVSSILRPIAFFCSAQCEGGTIGGAEAGIPSLTILQMPVGNLCYHPTVSDNFLVLSLQLPLKSLIRNPIYPNILTNFHSRYLWDSACKYIWIYMYIQ